MCTTSTPATRASGAPARRLLGHRGICLGICLAMTVLFSPLANAVERGPAGQDTAPPRPRIGLVLSGGGARGIAHIGVLKVLEQNRIAVDYIAGTSMGSIVGGTYASGMSIGEMTDFVLSTDWSDVFTDDPGRNALSLRRKGLDSRNLFGLEVGYGDGQFKMPSGAISGQKLDLIMDDLGKRASGITNFNNLPIPFRATATDLETGELFLFDQGSLSTAMRASMSVPGAVAPVEYQGRMLVDGGLVRNLPVDIVREMGAEVVIAVNLGTPLLKRDELGSILGVAVQMVGILTEQNVQRSLASLHEDDVLILPELGDISAASFERAEEAIQSGISAAQKVLPQLRRYSLPSREYLIHRGHQVSRIARAPRIVDEVRIGQLRRVNPEILESALQTRPGTELNEPQLKEDLARLYGRGDFERVNYRFFEEAGRGVVTINAYEKRWGPNYLRFGLNVESDFQGTTTGFNVLGSYDMTWLNSLGAEWRNDLQLGQNSFLNSEFFQPLAVNNGYFVAPYLRLADRIENLFDGNKKIAEYEVKTQGVGLGVGNQFNNWGELRINLSATHIDSSIDSGPRVLTSSNVFQGAVTGTFLVDTVDRTAFPTRGETGGLEVLASLDALGSADNYIKVGGAWNQTLSFGPNLFSLGLRAGTRFDGDLPPYDDYILGGFLRLSGYRPGQLRGQHLGFGRLVYYRKFRDLPRALGKGIYLGGSLEAGNAWEKGKGVTVESLNTGVSAFLGADTIIGPLYLGYGYAGSSNNTFYLYLGKL